MTTTTTFFRQFVIKIDGSDLAANLMDLLGEVIVEDDLAQPAMFVLRFYDPNFTITNGQQFDLGKEVTILATNSANRQVTLLTGEITSLEPEFEQRRTILVVRGYDRSHRLYRGSKTRTFTQQTDSAIAQTVVQGAGLQADIESTSVTHAYVIQHNQTDMEFLQERAARIGCRITVNGNKLQFKKLEQTPPDAPAQQWGHTLISFRMRLSGVAQPTTVTVQGWDPTSKSAITGSATTPSQPSKVGDKKKPGALAQQAFGSDATMLITDQPVALQGEADNLAQAALNEIADNAIAAEGFCIGEPALKAGTLVEVKGVGSKFSGKYFVTSTRHLYTPQEGYRTTFWVNGYRPNNIVGLLDDGGIRAPFKGVTIGLVTNNKDPDNLGRVKVKFPWLDSQLESNWARLALPGAGPQRGLLMVPEVNDEVLIAFEQGDMSKPYILGGLWNSTDAAPATAAKDGKVELRMIKTRIGHMITFDDESSTGGITIKTNGGQTITISDKDKKIEVKSQKHTITLDDQGDVKITSGGKVLVTATQDLDLSGPAGGKITIAASGIKLSSGGSELELAPAGAKLTSGAKVELQAGGQMGLQAGGQLEAKSGGLLGLKAGGMAELQAGGIATIMAPLVKINC